MAAGASISGFRETRWNTMRQIKPGDYLLCYLTGISRFIGVLEVASPAFKDTTPIWNDEAFPCRVEVTPVITLTPETAVPIHDLSGTLSIFQNLKSPMAWTGHVRGSPARWKESDGKAVVDALHQAKENPVARPVNAASLRRRPKAFKGPTGSVTVPEPETDEEVSGIIPNNLEPRVHAEVQYLLVKLGGEMGLDVWVARNDRGVVVNGKRISDLPRLRPKLPVQFDSVTQQIIELIDVLWLEGGAIVAAFEIESTTSIYSGLLRMSDLIAMQPNLKIPLYLVAPEERRDKVIREVNRPTFAKLSPPMTEMCQFISFSVLQKRLKEVEAYVRYLKPDFLAELAESCEVEEA
jgi:EVE domain